MQRTLVTGHLQALPEMSLLRRDTFFPSVLVLVRRRSSLREQGISPLLVVASRGPGSISRSRRRQAYFVVEKRDITTPLFFASARRRRERDGRVAFFLRGNVADGHGAVDGRSRQGQEALADGVEDRQHKGPASIVA